MSKSITSELSAEPDLTPLLDIVFQLITFFMLVINFSQDAYDARVKLPVAPSARPIDASQAAEDRLVLNVNANGFLLLNGKEYPPEGAAREIQLQADLVKLNFRNKKDFDPENLPTTMVIRADKGTPFDPLHKLIVACQTNGFRKFALKAMTGS
ncbi:MAG: biopolymer transporter ExbD [Isosphaeraceae bacterium]